MAIGKRLFGGTGGAEAAFEKFREHAAKHGGLIGFAPAHFRAGALMREIIQAEAETRAAIGQHDAAKFIEKFRLAVSGEAHHFIFVAKFPKAEILGERGVIHP